MASNPATSKKRCHLLTKRYLLLRIVAAGNLHKFVTFVPLKYNIVQKPLEIGIDLCKGGKVDDINNSGLYHFVFA